ncbi:MAG: aminoglycoside phosphotransferase family protein [Candidatus Undinarchaeales archaeon]
MVEREKVEKYLEKKFGKIKLNNFKELGKGVYGTAYLLDFDLENGKNKKLVLKNMNRGGFGHDYKADIAHNLILAHNTFNNLKKHIKSYDVIASNEELKSIGDAEDYYILLEEAEGEEYSKDLDRISETGKLEEKDRKRVVKLAEYLAEIHERIDKPELYVRRARDLVGHGEYIMGVLDGYPENSIKSERRVEIVCKCVHWWEKLRNYKERLSVIHGDYHPFNIMFKGEDFVLLDRSRGEYGEPADDLTGMLVNYLFWSLVKYGKLDNEFKELFKLFLNTYLEKTEDKEVLKVIQPFFTFRAVVVANPIFYSNDWFRKRGADPDEIRDKLLNLAENVLDIEKFEIEKVNEYLK